VLLRKADDVEDNGMGRLRIYREAAKQLATTLLKQESITQSDVEQLVQGNEEIMGNLLMGNVFAYHGSEKVTFQSMVMRSYWEKVLNGKPDI
jgi:hypothetical protein